MTAAVNTALFWAKVDKGGDCWNWTAAKSCDGYGHFRVGRSVRVAHRVSYELEHGPIAAGMLVDHICRTPACVNPTHLRQVTQKQNQEHRGFAQSNNQSGVRGVSWYAAQRRWMTEVGHNGRKYRKPFEDFDEACAYVVSLRNRLYTHNDLDRNAA